MIDLTVCLECGEPAEVLWRSVLFSTDGPIEHAKVLCVRNHCLFLPVESLPTLPGLTARSAERVDRSPGGPAPGHRRS